MNVTEALAACAAIDKPGWTGKLWADVKLAVEALVSATAEQRRTSAEMAASIAELRAERHRLEALCSRVEMALNPPCRHPAKRYSEGVIECELCGEQLGDGGEA